MILHFLYNWLFIRKSYYIRMLRLLAIENFFEKSKTQIKKEHIKEKLKIFLICDIFIVKYYKK